MTHLNSHAEPPKFALIDFSTHSNLRLSLHTTLETGSLGAHSYRPTSRQRIRNRNLGDRSATRSAAQRARNRVNAHLLGHGVRAHAQIYPAAAQKFSIAMRYTCRPSQAPDSHDHGWEMNESETCPPNLVSCLPPHTHTDPAINAHTPANHSFLSASVGIDRHRLSPVRWNRCAKNQHICASPFKGRLPQIFLPSP